MERHDNSGERFINRKHMKTQLENVLELDLGRSDVIAEVIYTPSFSANGRELYIQLRRSGDDVFILYCAQRPGTEDFSCGVKTVGNAFRHNITLLLAKASDLENYEDESGDAVGYYHEIYIAGEKYFFWKKDILPEGYEVLTEIAEEIMSLLPAEYHSI